jgi:cytochrome c-type biogenesis protein CcmE
MHPLRKQRLILVVFIIVFSSVAAGLLAYALRENINMFYSAGTIAAGEVPVNTRIRGGGCVKPGSIVRASDSLQVNFVITDGEADVPVSYSGILPDLFSEGEAAVVNGTLDEQGVFQATQVLAKHDENYMPPEVADSMKASGDYKMTCLEAMYGS